MEFLVSTDYLPISSLPITLKPFKFLDEYRDTLKSEIYEFRLQEYLPSEALFFNSRRLSRSSLCRFYNFDFPLYLFLCPRVFDIAVRSLDR